MIPYGWLYHNSRKYYVKKITAPNLILNEIMHKGDNFQGAISSVLDEIVSQMFSRFRSNEV